MTISINWHELRILIIWAENWAHKFNGAGVVYAIARRIAQQHPKLAAEIPLTLAGEVQQLKDAFGKDNVKTSIKGTEGG